MIGTPRPVHEAARELPVSDGAEGAVLAGFYFPSDVDGPIKSAAAAATDRRKRDILFTNG